MKTWKIWEEGLGFGASGACGYKGDMDFQSHDRRQSAGAESAESKGGCLSLGPRREGMDVPLTAIHKKIINHAKSSHAPRPP